jgi:hypothetical protein
MLPASERRSVDGLSTCKGRARRMSFMLCQSFIPFYCDACVSDGARLMVSSRGRITDNKWVMLVGSDTTGEQEDSHGRRGGVPRYS